MIDWIFAWWWVWILEAVIAAGIVGLIALGASRIVGDAPTSLGALKASMALTVLALLGGYIIVLWLASTVMTSYMGVSGEGLVLGLTILAALMIIAQWLFSPYIINIVYRVREPGPGEEWIIAEVERLAKASGIKMPKVVISELNMPNAFAYGSPIAGSYVAVTRGLLRLMPRDEVRAVLAHEVGHLKHRDVTVILALTLIPIAVYFIGRALLWAGLLGGGERRGSPLALAALGAAMIALGVIFEMIVAHFNRLREYYADAHSALTLGTPRPLQRALARLQLAYEGNPHLVEEAKSNEMAAMLFIVAPLVEMSGGFFYDIDYAVEQLKRRETNPLLELFSTHPPIPKRLRFLDRVALRISES